MTALALYYAELDERRALEDIEDAAAEAAAAFAAGLNTLNAAELDEPMVLEDLADTARFKAVMAYGVDYDDLPTVEALIAGADIPARIAVRAAGYEVAA